MVTEKEKGWKKCLKERRARVRQMGDKKREKKDRQTCKKIG